MELTDILVCEDCLQAIANDDYTGLDHHYRLDEADQRMAEIKAGLARLGQVYTGDHRRDQEFSQARCDCCGLARAGRRYHCWVEEKESDRV
jgi:hypothetical protein